MNRLKYAQIKIGIIVVRPAANDSSRQKARRACRLTFSWPISSMTGDIASVQAQLIQLHVDWEKLRMRSLKVTPLHLRLPLREGQHKGVLLNSVALLNGRQLKRGSSVSVKGGRVGELLHDEWLVQDSRSGTYLTVPSPLVWLVSPDDSPRASKKGRAVSVGPKLPTAGSRPYTETLTNNRELVKGLKEDLFEVWKSVISECRKAMQIVCAKKIGEVFASQSKNMKANVNASEMKSTLKKIENFNLQSPDEDERCALELSISKANQIIAENKAESTITKTAASLAPELISTLNAFKDIELSYKKYKESKKPKFHYSMNKYSYPAFLDISPNLSPYETEPAYVNLPRRKKGDSRKLAARPESESAAERSRFSRPLTPIQGLPLAKRKAMLFFHRGYSQPPVFASLENTDFAGDSATLNSQWSAYSCPLASSTIDGVYYLGGRSKGPLVLDRRYWLGDVDGLERRQRFGTLPRLRLSSSGQESELIGETLGEAKPSKGMRAVKWRRKYHFTFCPNLKRSHARLQKRPATISFQPVAMSPMPSTAKNSLSGSGKKPLHRIFNIHYPSVFRQRTRNRAAENGMTVEALNLEGADVLTPISSPACSPKSLDYPEAMEGGIEAVESSTAVHSFFKKSKEFNARSRTEVLTSVSYNTLDSGCFTEQESPKRGESPSPEKISPQAAALDDRGMALTRNQGVLAVSSRCMFDVNCQIAELKGEPHFRPERRANSHSAVCQMGVLQVSTGIDPIHFEGHPALIGSQQGVGKKVQVGRSLLAPDKRRFLLNGGLEAPQLIVPELEAKLASEWTPVECTERRTVNATCGVQCCHFFQQTDPRKLGFVATQYLQTDEAPRLSEAVTTSCYLWEGRDVAIQKEDFRGRLSGIACEVTFDSPIWPRDAYQTLPITTQSSNNSLKICINLDGTCGSVEPPKSLGLIRSQSCSRLHL